MVSLQKCNTDVLNEYSKIINIREKQQYNPTTTLWKGIIGPIQKQKISKNDFKITVVPPDHKKIINDYNERNSLLNKEKQELKKTKNDKKLEPINNIQENLSQTFDELKNSAITMSATELADKLNMIDDIIAKLDKF